MALKRLLIGTNSQVCDRNTFMRHAHSILIAIHSLFTSGGMPVSGTGSSLFALFMERNIPFTCYHFPIYGGKQTRIHDYNLTGSRWMDGPMSSSSLLRRSFMEAITIFLSVIKKPVDLYIGIDPVNALWGIIGKRILRRVKHVIYYTADYAVNRFSSPVLNMAYHVIDRLCIRYADQVWNVSTKIMAIRASQGVEASRNVFVPNAPMGPFRGGKHNAHDLIVVGTSVTAFAYDVVLSALPEISREFPAVKLHIIGEFRFPPSLRKIVRTLEKRGMVVLHGPLSHDHVIRLLSRAGIGLALYKDVEPWTRYGDSMKMREYFAAGLPVIATDVVSTSDVLREYGCGCVISPTVPELVRAVRSIYARNSYGNMQRASLAAAKRYAYVEMVRTSLSLAGVTV